MSEISTSLNAQPSKGSMVKTVSAATIGNALEWYDYGLYGFFAPIIATQYFTSKDPLTNLLLTFIIFGVGFCLRPLGGIVFGSMADRHGRRATLSLTVLLMGISTFALGVIPTYAQIGIAAPILIAVCRLSQGLATGGEFGSCNAMLCETAKPQNRAYIMSFSTASLAIGLLAGSFSGTLLASILSKEALNAWGWRIPFLFGIVIAIYGRYLRKGIEESSVFQKAVNEKAIVESPFKEVVTNNKRELLIVFCMVVGTSVAYWIINSYMTTYLSQVMNLPIATALKLNTFMLILFIIALPIFAKMVDKIGHKPMAFASFGGLLISYYPAFYIMTHTNSFGVIVAVLMYLALLNSAVTSVCIPMYTEAFPTKVRATGYGISYNFGQALFGGMAPFIATWLIKYTNNPMSLTIYLILTMLVAVIALFFVRETKGQEII